MTKCPNCEKENPENVQICLYCGTPIVDVKNYQTTRSLNDPDFEDGVSKWGKSKINREMTLEIEVENENVAFSFPSRNIDELLVGRRDGDTKRIPDVDLTHVNGHDKGVSRQHAFIRRQGTSLYIIDNASSNGTYLNGQRLFHNQPRLLRDGDSLRLGFLSLKVNFGVVEIVEDAPQPSRDDVIEPPNEKPKPSFMMPAKSDSQTEKPKPSFTKKEIPAKSAKKAEVQKDAKPSITQTNQPKSESNASKPTQKTARPIIKPLQKLNGESKNTDTKPGSKSDDPKMMPPASTPKNHSNGNGNAP